MVEGQHLLKAEDIPILRKNKALDIKSRLQRAFQIQYASELILQLLSFEPKERLNLEWVLEHPFLRAQAIPIYFKVFNANRGSTLTLLTQVPRGQRCVQYLIDELNRKVPPFTKVQPRSTLGSGASSLRSGSFFFSVCMFSFKHPHLHYLYQTVLVLFIVFDSRPWFFFFFWCCETFFEFQLHSWNSRSIY
jgi:serine/threonine protein kinase